MQHQYDYNCTCERCRDYELNLNALAQRDSRRDKERHERMRQIRAGRSYDRDTSSW